MIGLGEEVEWRARHFGLWMKMKVRITAWDFPVYFQDAMVKGPLAYFCHDHSFQESDSGTVMTDEIKFASRVPVLGRMIDALVLKNHFLKLISVRNDLLKAIAESDEWRKYLIEQK